MKKPDKFKTQLCVVLLGIIENQNVYSQGLSGELQKLINMVEAQDGED